MSGSGLKTGKVAINQEMLPIQWGLQQAPTGFTVVAAGASMRPPAGLRFATATARAAGAATWGSALSGLLEIYLKVTLCFFYPFTL